ncbi:MAG TPA: DUF488 domain-containing protein [Phycisphaerales bacterium]|nr:DUF488 domain-containing protein [Phycisphaerales bacterium]
MVSPGESSRTLWSIGHSNHTIEHFVDLLRSNRIDVVVDVRTSPYSKFAQQFAREVLASVLPRADVKYLFLGKELGGRPTGGRYYDRDGHVLYGELARADLFRAGIDRLEQGMAQYRCAIMCSEENPCVCHRHLLVSRVLRDRGTDIRHIRGDGRCETFVQAEREARELEGRVETLFGEEAPHPWRSLRSVLQDAARAGSSET